MAVKKKSVTRRLTSRKTSKNFPVQPGLFRRATDLSPVTHDLIDARVDCEDKDPGLFRRRSDLECLDDLSDSELIEVIHMQNREAYKELFLRYQKKLFTYIYHLVGNREETEDILQNVFSKTYKNIKHFDTTRKFSSWIYRIAHNESVNYLKRKSKRYTVSWDDISTSKDKLDSASNEELPEDRIGHQEVSEEIDAALQKIPKKYQQVLRLRYFQEYSYEQMGKVLGKPVNTVGTLINRAKKKLLEAVRKDQV